MEDRIRLGDHSDHPNDLSSFVCDAKMSPNLQIFYGKLGTFEVCQLRTADANFVGFSLDFNLSKCKKYNPG